MNHLRAYEIPQWIKVLASKSDHLAGPKGSMESIFKKVVTGGQLQSVSMKSIKDSLTEDKRKEEAGKASDLL